MKILVLAAIIVAVSSGRLSGNKNAKVVQGEKSQWPWVVGQVYRYDVETHNLAYLQEGASTGNSFRARFTVRVKAPGYLLAKLENPENAQIHQELKPHEPLPEDLKYQAVPKLDAPFEINYDGGRILSLNLPSTVPLAHENLLKGLIGALQVDLTTYRNVHSSYDTYDNVSHQGLFRKMETDVTGDCETLYTISPAAVEWRRELPAFTSEEDPMEITKSKNYGHCHHRVDYHFGVPQGAEWSGTAHKSEKEQFIQRAMVSRILVGKNGPIYKSETTSTVNVHPHLYGKQKAEVHSKVSFRLISKEEDVEPEWPMPEGVREILNLLYSLTPKQVDIAEDSSSSSSESVENHINVEKYNRERRSARPKSIVAVNKVIVKRRSQDTSSSSSSESASAYVNDDVPKTNEPAYAALYMNPQARNDKKQNPMNAQKLVQEIAQQLQNPSNMPKADLLSKFNILVRVIASMSYGQLSQTSRSIEIAKSSIDSVKSDMWMVYRDAVAQAGTLPAFQQIKSWIQTKKLEGEEAAEVISSLVKSLRYPTKECMMQFFDLAMSPEVISQMYLNSTALIAATTYINMGQVNNETSHRYYPTHMYGRLSKKHDHFVEVEILPRLNAEFRLAMEQGDTHKSQVYIKAIGHLGHGAILDVFAPYLEGKLPASTYLRTKIVESLNVLAYQRDHRVRAVLFSILRNTAEPYEVRVAAIQNIFMGRPTTTMMQVMAHMTKEDPSRNVRSALKSAIVSAAQLKHPRFYDLAQTAAAVLDMLTEEDFGLQYSKKNLMEYFDRDHQYGVMSILSTIGSKDSFFPKSLKYSWKNRVSGWDEEAMLWASASNSQRVVDYFLDQIFETKENINGVLNHKYSAKKISEMLNINRKEEPLEASLYMDFMNQQRYFAFNEQDIKDYSIQVNEYLANLMKGANKHYTKIVNRNQVSVMFPIASGMPFVFKYKEPTVLHIQATSKGKVDFKNRENYETDINIDKDLWFTYATNNDGCVGYLDTLSNQYPNVGLVRKFQVHLPVKMQFETKRGEFKLRLAPKEPELDNTLIHYSVWPYSSSQKKDSLVPLSQDPSAKVITRPKKVVSVDYKFGQQIGQLFQVQGYSYSKDFENFGNFIQYKDIVSNIISAFRQHDIAQTHFNLRYLGKQSKNKDITITAVYDTLYNQKNEGQMAPVASDMTDVTPNSPARRQELAKRVTAGINAARSQVIDLSVQIDSPDKLEYALTFAVGNSNVDRKIQYAFFASKNLGSTSNQINAVGILTKPLLISPINFQEAVQQELKMDFEADIRYNQKENIHIQGNTERTMKYAEELQKYPLAMQCMEEIQNGNYYQRACHKAIIMAHAPDSFKFTVTYKDVSPSVRSTFQQWYRIAQSLGIWQLESNDLKVNPVGKIDINLDASYLSQTLNLYLKSSLGEMRWKNVRIPKSSAAAVATYWPIKPYERVMNYYTSHQYQPYCSIDNSMVRSFSDRSYNYKLTSSWHVVLHDERVSNSDELVVLARRPNEKQQEIYISYRSYSGVDMEIEIQPTPEGQKKPVVKVNTKAKMVSEGDLTTYWDDVDETPILEYYVEGNGVLVLKIRENRLRIMYDGLRSVVFANEKRMRTRGICGYMSGEPRDDYLTPYGLIDAPEYYAASYVLIDENSKPVDKERLEQAKKMAYQPRKWYTSILRTDEDWKNKMLLSSDEPWGSQIIYRTRNYLKEKMPCELRPQVQYYESQGEICITTAPLPACQSHCSGEGFKIEQAQVVCKSTFDLQFRSVRDQIRLGQNPQVNGVPLSTQFRVPASCKA